jgi:hypothetical protein
MNIKMQQVTRFGAVLCFLIGVAGYWFGAPDNALILNFGTAAYLAGAANWQN